MRTFRSRCLNTHLQLDYLFGSLALSFPLAHLVLHLQLLHLAPRTVTRRGRGAIGRDVHRFGVHTDGALRLAPPENAAGDEDHHEQHHAHHRV